MKNRTETEFIGFPKISRYSRECVVTEKIDGTNACIFIGDNDVFLVGSRTQWITPEDDNYGFAQWAYDHKEKLMTLGKGRHFGEWWGNGINRGYGLAKGEKRLSLFNVQRWCLRGQEPQHMQNVLPLCVGLVPILWRGQFDELNVSAILEELRINGSHVVPGYSRPEGIIIFHIAGNIGFKKTLEKDG